MQDATWFTEELSPPVPPRRRLDVDFNHVFALVNLAGALFLLYAIFLSGEFGFTTELPFVTLTPNHGMLVRPSEIVIPRAEMELLGDVWERVVAEGVEQGACLTIENGMVTSVTPASVREQTEDSLIFTKTCKQASLHTHDNGVCSMSPRDAIYFWESGNDYLAIMCGPAKLGLYDLDELQESYKVRVLD